MKHIDPPQRRFRTFALAVLLLTPVAALVVGCEFAKEGAGTAPAGPNVRETTPAVLNESRTEEHSAPHIDLPPGVFIFTDGSSVYTVHPDGAGLTNVGTAPGFTRGVLARGGSRVNFEPAVPSPFAPQSRLSPDGWRLATFDSAGVHVANADGSDSRLVSAEITQSPPTSSIAWANDTRHLLVLGGRGFVNGSSTGALFDVDDDSRQLLPATDMAIAISPLADRIAYGGQPNGLRVARPDGSDSIEVNRGLEVAPYDLWNVAWAPDGDRLAFPVAGVGHGSAIAASDGSETIPIPAVPAASTALVSSFAWSPDGRYLAVTGDQDPIDHHRVLVFDTRNLDAAPLAFDAGLLGDGGVPIIWWDDGAGFYFVGRGAYAGEGVGRLALYSVSLDGKTEIKLSGDVGVASMIGMTH